MKPKRQCRGIGNVVLEPQKEKVFEVMDNIRRRQEELASEFEKTGDLGLVDEFIRLTDDWMGVSGRLIDGTAQV